MDNLSKVIEAEAEVFKNAPYYENGKPLSVAPRLYLGRGFVSGAKWMAGHLEGFAEWLDRNAFTRVEPGEWSSDKLLDYSQFTTSQLVYKYFNELNTKP